MLVVDLTFEQPIGVTFFGGVGFEEGEKVRGKIANNIGRKVAALAVGNVFCFDDFVGLNDAVDVVAHGQFGHVAHQVVEPTVDAGKDIDGLVHVPIESEKEISVEGFVCARCNEPIGWRMRTETTAKERRSKNSSRDQGIERFVRLLRL